MKKKTFIIFVFLLFIVQKLNAHEYHFSFAEVEYNSDCACLQSSISITAHDLESSLQKKGFLVGSLQNELANNGFSKAIKKELLTHFRMNISQSDGQNCLVNLLIEGHEFSMDGLLHIYFSSKNINITDSSTIHFKFDLLMDVFNEQQNKLTFTYKSIKQTISFLKESRESDLLLSLPKRKIND
ncbi:MAG: hypothetical protein P8I93_05185 [Crocinitomicaceae bacterium]|nr:hypothetical protein [Crocinitomicaceae bacterium]